MRAGRVVASARNAMVVAAVPGVTTGELDAIGRDIFRSFGARSAPKLTYNFPGSTCISVNSEAAHGIPRLAQSDAMDAARAGNKLRDIGRAVQRRARRNGFCVIKNLYGHGIGRALHEEPSVPSVDDHQHSGLWEGLVLAVEPFLSVSAHYVVDDADGWTLRTDDGSLVAQFEHTMVVTCGQPIVLTL